MRGGLGPLALLALLTTASCVPGRRSHERHEVAIWDFPPEERAASLALVPPGPGAPAREKRALTTATAGEILTVVVSGPDPCLAWKLREPREAAMVGVTLEAEAPGPLQVFWSNRACPTFSESCSAVRALVPGRQTVEVLLDVTDPLREIRVDFPERAGARFVVHAVSLFMEPRLTSAWEPGAPETRVDVDDSGLHARASAADPWIFVMTPGLRASRATSVEIVLRAPSGPPQLYWDGPCGGFAEECSVRLTRTDAGDLTHRASLSEVSTWKGPLGALRLDPGPSAGTYTLERAVLVSEPE